MDQLSAENQTTDATTTQVCRLIGETLIVDPPPPDLDLIESELIDSLALMALIAAIEEEFAVRLAPEQLNAESFRTPARIAACVASSGERAR